VTAQANFLGLPNIGDIFGDVVKILPPVIGDALKDTVGKILDPNDNSINIGDPQPPGTPPIPVDAGSPELNTVARALKTAVDALNTALKLVGWLIPDKYEGYIKDVIGALLTVEGWLS
jgi:hypothetical protein